MIRLFELRTEKELSQREMAKILNVSQGTYNNWENAKTQPSIEQLIALAKFFGVSVDDLVGFGDSESIYAKPAHTKKEQELLQAFRALSPDTQNLVFSLVQKLEK